jgi:hypothetical protein
MVNWSREMLSTTRMLESSTVAAAPAMRRLLEDLDLVETEIVHYTGTGTYRADDLDMIEQSLIQRGVMTKLRTTIPQTVPATARASSAGT